METANQGRVGEQNEAYRKGLVLGLTMAEVAILIIFVLLLLLVFGELQRVEVLAKFEGKEPITPTELAQLRAGGATLQRIAHEMGVQFADTSEDFTRLVRVLREGMRSPTARAAVSDANGALQDIKHARTEVKRVLDSARNGGSEAVARQVEQQGYRIGNQEGQLQRLERRLQEAGQGKGERPCWAQQFGQIDYLYEVVLTSAGIRMREYPYPDGSERAVQRRSLPAPRADPNQTLSEEEFLRGTKPLFDWSRQNDCRFFVVVYDATASHEKPLYKSLLRTVEGHFYKRLDNRLAPF
jgi:hypothetical protein